MEWLIFLVLGAFAGLLAGLFGVGGGAIIVPILIIVFDFLEFVPSLAVHFALGTSFATIVVTSVSSLLAHQRLGNIRWLIWRVMTPGLIVGVLFGSLLAMKISGTQLQLGIAIFFMLVSVQMFFSLQPQASFRRLGALSQMVAGGVIGLFSAFFGIGGGSLSVPWLTLVGEPMKNAVATSAACGLPIAFAGAFSYGWLASDVNQQIQWTTGYIYWPAFIGVVLTSIPLAKVGASFASSLPEPVLKKLFALLLFGLSIYMVLAN